MTDKENTDVNVAANDVLVEFNETVLAENHEESDGEDNKQGNAVMNNVVGYSYVVIGTRKRI